MFQFLKLDLPDAYLITSFSSTDHRGNFIKYFEQDVFRENGIEFHCNEDFISRSNKNVVRGLHFQTHNPQAKLIGVISGDVYDVIVDLRHQSPTFGQWRGFYLSAENKHSLLVPRGFAHGFMALTGDSVVSYKCDGPYDKGSDAAIRFDDEELKINWPIHNLSHVIISDRDRNAMNFGEFKKNFQM